MDKHAWVLVLGMACATSSTPGDAGPDGPQMPACGDRGPCAEGQVCCLTTSECGAPGSCAPSPDPLRCTSSDECLPDESCVHLGGCGAALGRCLALDECWAPGPVGDVVCGCDGRTYERACDALSLGGGIASSSGGGCGEPVRWGDPTDCGPTTRCGADEFCDSDAGVCRSEQSIEICGADANCPTGKVCCREAGYCVPADCPECCRPLEDGEHAPCTNDEECTYAFIVSYCDGDACDGPGACRSLPTSCDGTVAEVCGCNGATYQNGCEAARAGTRVASEGRCP